MAAARLAPDKSVSAVVLRKMLVAGSKMLEVNKESVNALNVFPVPDGDTGTNMSLTMISAMKEVCKNTTNTMEALCQDLTKGALRGARGNSGVILSQILKGFANVVSPQEELDIKNFARALKSGVELAYSAVAKPKEGTMLTVIRVMTEHALEISKKPLTYDNFLSALIEKGEEILAQTPEMLDVLKKAGVVDSGGAGLMAIYLGYKMAVDGEEIENVSDIAKNLTALMEKPAAQIEAGAATGAASDAGGEIEFGYCTETFITPLKEGTDEKDANALRDKLMEFGDCVLVVLDENLIKVHCHSNDPGRVLRYCIRLGELDNVKVENMRSQHRTLIAEAQDLHEDAVPPMEKDVGFVAVAAGEGLAALFRDLTVDEIVQGGQTMNPSTEDIVKAVQRCKSRTTFVLPNNKNIIMAAQQVDALTPKTVVVIPSKTVPQGITAMLSFAPEGSVEENTAALTEALDTVDTMQITYAARNSDFDGYNIHEGDYLALYGSQLFGTSQDIRVLLKSLAEKVRDDGKEYITIYYGEDVKEKHAQKAADIFADICPNADVNLLSGGQPVYYYLISAE